MKPILFLLLALTGCPAYPVVLVLGAGPGQMVCRPNPDGPAEKALVLTAGPK